jgi:hypothetical protein
MAALTVAGAWRGAPSPAFAVPGPLPDTASPGSTSSLPRSAR